MNTRDYADYYQRINAMAKDKKWNDQQIADALKNT